MSLGLPPKYNGEIHLEQTETPRQFLTLAVETAKGFGWNIDFVSEKQAVFFNKNEFKWHARVTFKIEGRWAYIKSESAGGELFDWGKNKRTVDEFTGVFNTLKKSFTPEEIDVRYEALEPILAAPGHEIPVRPDVKKIKGFLYLFVPREGYFITPIILDLNLLIFLLMVASGANVMHVDKNIMIEWGANIKPLVMDGQWWRLLTNFFIHFGIGHLFMNMLVLIYIGLLLEPRIGKVRFAIAYIFMGVAGSVTSLWWHNFVVSAGASGAIFGLFGVFLALLLTNVTEKEHRNAMLVNVIVFVLYILVSGMKAGIDDSAHLGGLIAGLVIGFSFYPALEKPELKIRNAIISGGGFAGIIVVLALIVMHTSDPEARFDKLKGQFNYCEYKALSFYRTPHHSEKKKLHLIEAEGIAYWKACEEVLNKMDSIPNLPARLKAKTSLLRKYCENRLIVYRFMDKTVREHTKGYTVLITLYNRKISLIKKKLRGEKVDSDLLTYKIGPGLFPKLPRGFLYVVNGGPVLDSVNIRPSDIKSIHFLFPRTSYQIYGKRGIHGTYMIETKRDNIHSYKPGKISLR